LSVVLPIGDAIESHRRGTGTDHRHANPKNLPHSGKTIRGEYRAQKGKRQREERVLDLDHLERDADVF
jgi:hypothetical protein